MDLVACLKAFVPSRVWMVTRVHGDDWNVLLVDDAEDEIKAGMVFHWPDSYCSRMALGLGPRFAPDAQAVPEYAKAEINRLMRIGSYIGQPLLGTDGVLLGTLCAVDSAPRGAFTPTQVLLVETISRTMSTLIGGKLMLEQLRQAEARQRYLAELDALTGLLNRHGWELALAEEETALKNLGGNAMVMMIDLDGLKQANDTKGHAFGDQYIQNAAQTLRRQLREADIIARLGGDEFGVIVRDTNKGAAELLHQRVRAAFEEAKVPASTGFAMRLSFRTLTEALDAADAQMYQDKMARKRAAAGEGSYPA
jgi:diguanylate cyclase (GGDEF)-like protein